MTEAELELAMLLEICRPKKYTEMGSNWWDQEKVLLGFVF